MHCSRPEPGRFAREPGRVSGPPLRTLAALESQAAVVQAVLAAEALTAAVETVQGRGDSRRDDDLRLLDASQVADLLETSKAVVSEPACSKVASVCAASGAVANDLRGLRSRPSFLLDRVRRLGSSRRTVQRAESLPSQCA